MNIVHHDYTIRQDFLIFHDMHTTMMNCSIWRSLTNLPEFLTFFIRNLMITNTRVYKSCLCHIEMTI